MAAQIKYEADEMAQQGYPTDENQYYQYEMPPMQEDDENSFDPSDFFMHSALANEAAQQQIKMEEDSNPVAMETDIKKDLQVSESEDSDDGVDAGHGGHQDDGFDINAFF